MKDSGEGFEAEVSRVDLIEHMYKYAGAGSRRGTGEKIMRRILCAFLCLSLGACAASGPAFNAASHSKPVGDERGKLIVYQGNGAGANIHPIHVGGEKLGVLKLSGFFVYENVPGKYVLDTVGDDTSASRVMSAMTLGMASVDELQSNLRTRSADPIVIELQAGQTVYVELVPNAKQKDWLARCGEDNDSITICERRVTVPQFEIRAEEDALQVLAGLKEST